MVLTTFLTSMFVRLLRDPHRHIEFIIILTISLLIPCVIDSQGSTKNGGTSKIIDGEISASLVFILEEGKAFAFSGLFVPHQLKPDRFAELGENGNNITFGQVERETTDVYVGCIAVVSMPGRRRWSSEESASMQSQAFRGTCTHFSSSRLFRFCTSRTEFIAQRRTSAVVFVEGLQQETLTLAGYFGNYLPKFSRTKENGCSPKNTRMPGVSTE